MGLSGGAASSWGGGANQEMVLEGRQVAAGSRPQEEAISTGEDPIEDGQKGLGG